MSEQEKNGQVTDENNGQNKPVVKKEDKPVKKAENKPSFIQKTGKFIRDLRAEAKKVIWPTKKQTINNTVVVIVVAVVVCLFVALLDTTFSFVRDFIARLVA